jgi:hypothetical protein
MPKWANMMYSARCQRSWAGFGTGRNGAGASVDSAVAEVASRIPANKMRMECDVM